MQTLPTPELILFDWHGTLVNTHDAMYAAIEEMLPRLEDLGLIQHIRPEAEARNASDEKLIRYIRIFRHLHPRVLAEQRISRTDIFEVLFGDNHTALEIAHEAYNEAYRAHFGKVIPFQEGMLDYLLFLKKNGIRIGVLTNRHREFLQEELERVDNGRWHDLFDVTLCGNEAPRYKPEPDGLQLLIRQFGVQSPQSLWYVGDSVTDMYTAKRAGVTRIFYNGAFWPEEWFTEMFQQGDYAPQAVVGNFDQLLDLLQAQPEQRPPRLAPPTPPPPRQEPDWHPALAQLSPPKIILFDWHATLVDTLDAMYHAVDDMLKELKDMQLLEQLVDTATCKNPEDEKLVAYVRDNLSLHPKIKLDRKISRTDIFEVLFGDNEAAKRVAHAGFTKHYRNYFGTALPFEPKVRHVLEGLITLGIPIGVITNRDREFFIHELNTIDGDGWASLFQCEVCGDDTTQRKPHPDQIFLAAEKMQATVDETLWYVGDSTTDVIAAKTAGITSVFFNGALWDLPWLNKIFPGNKRFPFKPDVVVNDFSEFWALVLSCRNRARKRQ
ncbi:MAG: HAD-IA family hydrolase [Oleiphilaceae bacterium]|nr:HAD-IA family hydrolase [Oleiphilaceae bacterium]